MQTPFEEKGGGTWTTWAEAMTFLHALAAASPRAQVVQIGRSLTNNRPILALAVGDPAPRLLSGPVAFHVAAQHGFEHTTYEAALAQARDLTLADDPATVAYLQECTWLILPSAAPDLMGWAKYNENGIDLNRDHVNRVTPEARAIAWALHTYKPCLTIDSHSAHMSWDFAAAYPNDTLGNHPDVVATSRAAMLAVADAYTDAGLVFRQYTHARDLRDVLSNAAAFAHSPTILFEGSRTLDPLVTMEHTKLALDAVQVHHAAHLADYVAASQASRTALAPPIVADFR